MKLNAVACSPTAARDSAAALAHSVLALVAVTSPPSQTPAAALCTPICLKAPGLRHGPRAPSPVVALHGGTRVLPPPPGLSVARRGLAGPAAPRGLPRPLPPSPWMVSPSRRGKVCLPGSSSSRPGGRTYGSSTPRSRARTRSSGSGVFTVRAPVPAARHGQCCARRRRGRTGNAAPSAAAMAVQSAPGNDLGRLAGHL